MSDLENDTVRAQINCAFFEELFEDLYWDGFHQGGVWSVEAASAADLELLMRYRETVQNLYRRLYGLASSSGSVSQRVFYALYPCYDGDDVKSRRFWRSLEDYEFRVFDFVDIIAGFIDGALSCDGKHDHEQEFEEAEDYSPNDFQFDEQDSVIEESEIPIVVRDWNAITKQVASFDREERMSAIRIFDAEFPPAAPLPTQLYVRLIKASHDSEVAALDRLLRDREPDRYEIMPEFMQILAETKAFRAEISTLDIAEAEGRIQSLIEDLDSFRNCNSSARTSMLLTSYCLLFPDQVSQILEAWATRPLLRDWLSITLQAITTRDPFVAKELGAYVSDSDTKIAGLALLILVLAKHGEFVAQASVDVRIGALSQAHHRLSLGDLRFQAILEDALGDESEVVRRYARSLLLLEGDSISDGQ